MRPLITPVGVLYVFAAFGSGALAVMLSLYALFPALIGVVAVDGVAKGEDGAFGAMVMMFGTTFAVGVFAAIAGLLAVLYLVDGIGLIARKPWARWLGVALAVPLFVICAPVGAMFGLVSLLTLVLPDANEEFAGHDAQPE